MPFDFHQTFQDLMNEKGDVMSGYRIIAGEQESRTHIQVDYFCIADLDRPYTGPESGIRPLADLTRYNVIELEGLGRTLSEGRFRYHLGRTLVMEEPSGAPSRQGQISLTILTVHKPAKLLRQKYYGFKEITPWKYGATLLRNLQVTIIILRALQREKGGESLAWLQLLEPDPLRRPAAWANILDQDLTSRERIKSIMIKMDEEAFMTIAEELRVEGRVAAKAEVARNLMRKGFDIAFIVEITGLSKDQLEQIAADMN